MESLKDRTQELQDIMDEFAGAKKNASIFVKEAAEKAFNAGVEMDMMNRCYDAHLAALVREGKVSQEKLDGPDSDLLQPPPERPHPSGQISGHPQHAAL